MTTYSTIPTKEQLGLLMRVKEIPGLRTFPIELLAMMQDVTKEEAIGLNDLCMKTKTPIFDWTPPLVAETPVSPTATEPEPPPSSPEPPAETS